MRSGTLTRLAAGGRDWEVVAGSDAIVSVAAPAPPGVLESVARRLRDPDCPLEALVGELPLGGVAGRIADFAIVWRDRNGPAGRCTAVVRGDGVIDLHSPGGWRRLESQGIVPWHLAEFSDVDAVRIGAFADPLPMAVEVAGDRPPLGEAFRAGSVVWVDAAVAPVAPEDPFLPVVGERAGAPGVRGRLRPVDLRQPRRPARRQVRRPDPASRAASRPAAPGGAAAPHPPASAPPGVSAPPPMAPGSVPPHPPVTPAAGRAAPSIAPAAGGAAPSIAPAAGRAAPAVPRTVGGAAPLVPPVRIDPGPETPRPPVTAAPAVAVRPVPGGSPVLPDESAVRPDGSADRPGGSAAVGPAAPAVPSPAAPEAAPLDADGRYRLGDDVRRVQTVALIGRNPSHRRVEPAGVDLVAVPGSEAVSSTHLELRREGDRIVAVDLGSRNGTVLITARGRRRLRGGIGVVVDAGARLELGGDTIIEILPGEEPHA